MDDAVLAAGRRALRKWGYRGATMERIAAEAGLSRVTLHRRGVTKAKLLDALAERGVARYRQAMWPALTEEGPARDRLRLALNVLCEVAEENLELLVALRAQSDAIFHDDAREALTRDVFTQPLTRLLEDGARDGSLRAVDSLETGTTLFNLVGWTYVHLRAGHRWPPDRARASVVDIALCGVTATEKPVSEPRGARRGRSARSAR